MRSLRDQEESIPLRHNPTRLNVFGKYHCRGVILMRQFKPEAVGFELDMAGEQIEKRQKGKPEKSQREHNQR